MHDLTTFDVEILYLISDNNIMATKPLAELLNTNPADVQVRLSRMLDMGVIEERYLGNTTFYRIKESN
jgi:predicted transcriptional regulator